jgi:hypothetical protein
MTHLLALDRIILMGMGPSATKWLPQKPSESGLKHFKMQETQLSGELFSSFATNSLTQNLKHLHDRNR